MRTNLFVVFAMFVAGVLLSRAEVRNVCELPFPDGKVQLGGVNCLKYSKLPPPLSAKTASSTVLKSGSIGRSAAAELKAGDKFVNFYSNATDKLNCGFWIETDSAGIILKNFAEGIDLHATYDATTGKITIPTGVVIANDTTYGDVTLHALDIDAQQYNNQPITGTISGDSIVFDKGVYTTVTYQGETYFVNYMARMKAKVANALFTAKLGTVTYKYPLIVGKDTDSTIYMQGLSSFKYFYDIKLPLNVNMRARTLNQKFTLATVDSLPAEKRMCYIGGYLSGKITDVSFAPTTTENSTQISVANLWYCYHLEGTSYFGWTFKTVVINIDCNIFNMPIDGQTEVGDTDYPLLNGIYYALDRDNLTAEITGCLPSVTDLNIPATLTQAGKTYSVTSIAAEAFKANKTLVSVSFPSTMKKSGKNAFQTCSNLKTVKTPDLLSWCSIDFENSYSHPIYYAFPATQSKWGQFIVGDSINPTVIKVPEGVKSMKNTFYGYRALVGVTLPASLDSLRGGTFSQCRALPYIEIPSNVKSISTDFSNCVAMTEIKFLGNGLENLGGAFQFCTGLKTAVLPESLKTVGGYAFSGCSALEEIVVPANVTSIGNGAYNGCKAATRISFGSSLNSIGALAFNDCSAVEKIDCKAKNVPVAVEDAFTGMSDSIPVYVPTNSLSAYKADSVWSYFKNIMGDGTGVQPADNDMDSNIVPEYYDFYGRRIAKPEKGICIVRRGNHISKELIP